jgi:hypothetical protein
MLFETCKCLDVTCPIFADGHNHVIATVLAFFAELGRKPPHREMIEEQGLDYVLGKINQPVVTSHVSQLVGENQLDLGRAEARNRGGGQQDRRPKTADNRWDLDQRRPGKSNGPIHHRGKFLVLP